MDDRFKNIDEGKKDRIINAALEEFAENGYEKASTNVIVRNAGISRGLLYHYFKDKEELYNVLTKYAIDLLMKKVDTAIDWQESDILERIKQITFVKIELSRVYPELFNYVINFFTKDNNVQTMEEAYKLYESYGVNVQELFVKVYQKNVDYSKFKEPENIKVSLDIIRWTIEKWGEETLVKSKGNFTIDDMEVFGKEVDKYVDALKKAFYR